MEKITMPKSWQKKMAFHSDICDKHKVPIRKMVVNGSVVCPRCEIEKDTERLEEQMKLQHKGILSKKKYNVLLKDSILEDETLSFARVVNFEATEEEEIRNKELVIECINRYKDGLIFNVILQGNQGAGKSHLSYSILWELNETKKFECLFISIQAMIRKIKDSFNNKESKYTEEYFVTLLSQVDFLVLDDLGAETGAINTDKMASDFIHRILYAVSTSRQNKSTIITTNLDGTSLFTIYDKKLISRLFRRPKYIIFEDTTDKRTADIPF